MSDMKLFLIRRAENAQIMDKFCKEKFTGPDRMAYQAGFLESMVAALLSCPNRTEMLNMAKTYGVVPAK